MVDYQQIYHSFPDMCISLHPLTGEIITANEMLLDNLGYSLEELKQLSLYDLYHPDEHYKIQNNLDSIKQGRPPENHEFVVQKKNGETMDVTLRVSFVKDEKGNLMYTNAVWRDISELKQVQRELELEKEKVEQQHKVIARQNRDFKDAVNYASNLQRGILPTESERCTVFPESFIFNKPKDVISGDFYWMYNRTGTPYVTFALLDCTGHGVPGALMSMMGAALLNQVVIEKGVRCPERILNDVRVGVIKSLGQGHEESTNSDGMDAILGVLNRETRELQFAGANSSFILLREKGKGAVITELCSTMKMNQLGESDGYDLYEFKGNKQPIGYYGGMGIIFSKSLVQLEEGDKLYLYSDGFQDQLGGERNKKYLSKRFRQFLLQIAELPMEIQRDALEEELARWQNDAVEQTDDICIWGITIQ